MMKLLLIQNLLENNTNLPKKIEWEPYFLIIATLTLVSAVIIPLAQKKYEEYRAKRNFKIYFKKQLGLVFNFLTSQKIEYSEPSIKKNPEKKHLEISDFLKKFNKDIKEYKNAVQPKIIFTLIMNLQNMLLYAFHLRNTIRSLEFNELMKLTLEHGNQLSKNELSNIYGLITILESFVSISLYHDRFGEMQSIKRLIQEKTWVGLKLDKDFLENQTVLNNDLQFINDKMNSVEEIIYILGITEDKTLEYFEYKK
jgi:hypothetical protein